MQIRPIAVVTGCLLGGAGLWARARAAGSVDVAAQVPASVIMTTGELRQDYEVLSVISQYQQLGFGVRGDPLEGAVRVGLEKLAEKAKVVGASAIVGLRMEFANRTEKDEGRLLLYGTLVRLK